MKTEEKGFVLVAPNTVDPGRFEVPHVIVVPPEEASEPPVWMSDGGGPS